MFHVYIMLIFGVLGFFMSKLKYPLAPMVLGIILGSGKHFGRSLGGFLVGSFLVIVGGALAVHLAGLVGTLAVFGGVCCIGYTELVIELRKAG